MYNRHKKTSKQMKFIAPVFILHLTNVVDYLCHLTSFDALLEVHTILDVQSCRLLQNMH